MRAENRKTCCSNRGTNTRPWVYQSNALPVRPLMQGMNYITLHLHIDSMIKLRDFLTFWLPKVVLKTFSPDILKSFISIEKTYLKIVKLKSHRLLNETWLNIFLQQYRLHTDYSALGSCVCMFMHWSEFMCSGAGPLQSWIFHLYEICMWIYMYTYSVEYEYIQCWIFCIRVVNRCATCVILIPAWAWNLPVKI